MPIGQFSGYLSEVFPSQLNIDATQFCNLACVHCPYETVTKLKGKARKNLDIDLHNKMVDEVASAGRGHCQYIRYTGDGEPLLHPQLPQMLKYAVDKTGVQVTVTTNGMLLTEERCADLIDAGVSMVDISIDAFKPETYAAVRVGGDLEVTRANVHRLIKMSKERGGPRVVVSFVKQGLNNDEADDFETYWNEAGVDFVVIRRPHSCGGTVADMAAELWAQAPKERKPCLYPWERLTIKADGVFTYCPVDWLHQADLGNIANMTIQEVWQGPEMVALREAHVNNTLNPNSLCGKCPDWSVVLWPDEGRSYATMMHEFDGEKEAVNA